MKKPIPHLRWYIAILLCLASELNYLDRQVLSVLADTIQRDLNLTTVEYSYITSSFLVSYTIMYAVSGRMVDRIGSRNGFSIYVAGWSIANILHAFAHTALQFSVFRFLLGVTEAANFPAGVKAISEWFPMRERALAIGIFNAGASIGAALAAPIASYIALTYGWRWAFVVTGALGFVWLAAWLAFYRLPQNHPYLGQAEKDLILSADEAATEIADSKISIKTLLSLRETWGCILVRLLTDPVTYFLIFWVPKYLQQERGFDLAALGRYAWIPYVALALGSVAGGATVRLLIGRGWTVNSARKWTMLAASVFIPLCYLLVVQTDDQLVALLALAGLMFGHNFWGNITLPAEIFPRGVIGTVSGLGGTAGGIAGIITQLSIGWMVQNVSFVPVFAVCAMVYLIALAIVQLLIGELGTIRKLTPITVS